MRNKIIWLALMPISGVGVDYDKTLRKAGLDWVSEGVEGRGDSDRVKDRDAVRPV